MKMRLLSMLIMEEVVVLKIKRLSSNLISKKGDVKYLKAFYDYSAPRS